MSGYTGGRVTMKTWEQSRAVRDFGPDNPMQTHVLSKLTTYTDETGYCYPFIETLARACRLCERHLRRNLTQLEDDGWLIVNRKAAADHRGNTYNLVLGKLVEVTGLPEPLTHRTPRAADDKVSGHLRQSHRTFETKSADISSIAIRKNDQERSVRERGRGASASARTRIPVDFKVTEEH